MVARPHWIMYDKMKQYYSLLKFAKKRFMQYKFNDYTSEQKDKEIILLMAFMYATGTANYYRRFRDATLKMERDLEIIKKMKEEHDE